MKSFHHFNTTNLCSFHPCNFRRQACVTPLLGFGDGSVSLWHIFRPQGATYYQKWNCMHFSVTTIQLLTGFEQIMFESLLWYVWVKCSQRICFGCSLAILGNPTLWMPTTKIVFQVSPFRQSICSYRWHENQYSGLWRQSSLNFY